MSRTPRILQVIGLMTAPLLVLFAPAATADVATAPTDGCERVLVTHSPTGSQGDLTSVAITSQVLVADVPGWETVAWEATDGVEVDKVLVENEQGTLTLDGSTQGQAGPATSLTFCGDAITASAAGAATDAPVGPLSLLGAGVGVVLAGLVLLLSHGARRSGRRADGAGREVVA
jgi:hypothetical protein